MKRTLTLERERPVSWNEYYAGQPWPVRRREAQRVHALVRFSLPEDARPFNGPVTVTLTAYFKDKPSDSCNLPAKLYIDGLTAKGEYKDGFRSWLWDDDLRFVTQTTTIPKMDPHNPRVVIELQEVDETAS